MAISSRLTPSLVTRIPPLFDGHGTHFWLVSNRREVPRAKVAQPPPWLLSNNSNFAAPAIFSLDTLPPRSLLRVRSSLDRGWLCVPVARWGVLIPGWRIYSCGGRPKRLKSPSSANTGQLCSTGLLGPWLWRSVGYPQGAWLPGRCGACCAQGCAVGLRLAIACR